MSRMKLQGRAAGFARPAAKCPAHLFVYAATHIVSFYAPEPQARAPWAQESTENRGI
jgi:hypothetical protein